MVKNNKKGQQAGGGGAATLVTVIALLIVLYILFLPPSEREKILGDTDTENDTTSTGTSGVNKSVLLFEHPGQLSHLKQNKIEHNIPSVNLYTIEEGVKLKEINSLYTKKALFTEEVRNLSFEVKDIKNSENFLLAFLAKEREGRLIISLNGREIFNRDVKTENIEPIKLPKELIKSNNILEFRVSSPGFAFWKTNEYLLENIIIAADITDLTKSQSRSVFIISDDEYSNVETVRIKFVADCDPTVVGPLEVSLNDYVIFSGIPDCQMKNIYEAAPFRLRPKENVLKFKAEEGFYIVDTIIVENKLRSPQDYIYYFELNKDEVEAVVNGSATVDLTFEFIDKTSWKDARLVINGKYIYINTQELTYSVNLDNYVTEGYNSIKIEPEKTMYVRNIKVELN